MGVKAKRVQCDEIRSFTAAKQKNVPNMKNPIEGAGDTWPKAGRPKTYKKQTDQP